MSPTNSLFAPIITFIIEAIIYIAAITAVFRRGDKGKLAAYLTGLYAFLSLLAQGITAMWQAGFISALQPFDMERGHWYLSLTFSFLLILILYAFLGEKKNTIWLAVAAFWAILLLLLPYNIFKLPEVVWTDGTWMIPRERLGFAVVTVGWLGFVLGSLSTYRRAYQNTREPLHRNRLRYWLPIFLLIFSADALFINTYFLWGAPLRVLGVWLLSYTITTHDLPDLQEITRGGLIYVSITIFSVVFYISGFALAQRLIPSAELLNPLFIGAGSALLLATIFRPVLSFIEKLIDRWMGLEHVNVSQTINDYSQSISNILDMERLANVTVSLIMEMMGIQRGFLFLVDKEARDGKSYYALRAIRNEGERPISAIWLDSSGPISEHFIEKQRPLLQFDLDLLPEFKSAASEERDWLKRLDADVYVPVFAKREWIGLFAFGGKISGNRYSKENLLTLSALAAQTAVALENARLVENLIELNNKVRVAYRDLESTKRDLERIDRTKSDFISIASHELRTPLTVMRGYTEMLLENPSLDKMTLKMLTGIHDGTLRLHEIMNSLFDIAQIDARTLELEFEPINISKLVYDVSTGQSERLRERKQKLAIDLPPLPGIQADPETLHKVFYHLISNAIKFTPDEGKIGIHGRSLSPGSELLAEGGIEIIVSDTGIGIDPALKEVIFTKFYQPNDQLNRHSTGKTKFKGSGVGLGLALSRGIVEAHGGKVWVESKGYDEEKCPGSHFHVTLPMRRQSEGNTLPISEALRTVI